MTNTHDHHEEEHSCCGGHHHDHDHEGGCCGSDHDHEGGCCGSDHDHEGSCCGGDHEHHHHTPVVTFENEDGTTEDHPIIDEFELDGNVYVLVMNSDETVTPLRVEGEEGELVFLAEEEFQKVSEAYAELVEAEEEEEDALQ